MPAFDLFKEFVLNTAFAGSHRLLRTSANSRCRSRANAQYRRPEPVPKDTKP